MRKVESTIEKQEVRHAYLIMCHTNFHQLFLLLDLLDDNRNDIYLHIDKKSRGYLITEIQRHIKKANLFFVKPMRVSWGGDSQIRLEIRLLVEATKKYHKYYHLISGMDLPLKTQNEIHQFFENNSGYDYVSLEESHQHNISKNFMDRINYFYLFQNYIGRCKKSFVYKLQKNMLLFQKK